MQASHQELYKIGERGTLVCIITNIALFLFKGFAGIVGRSHAMVADALHTASDLFTDLVILIGFKIAEKPADATHPYGHGRAESIASKIVSLLIIALGLKVAFDSLQALFTEDMVAPHQVALWAAALSIIVKEALYRYTMNLSNKISSASLKSEAWHHRSDALSSIAALVGIGGARMGLPILDPLAGVLVAIFVIRAGFKAFRTAYDELMDAAPSQNLMNKIMDITDEIEGVKAIKDIKTRKMGLELMIDMTIDLDKNLSVESSHKITEKIRQHILKHIPTTKDVLIHVEPYTLADGTAPPTGDETNKSNGRPQDNEKEMDN